MTCYLVLNSALQYVFRSLLLKLFLIRTSYKLKYTTASFVLILLVGAEILVDFCISNICFHLMNVAY